MYSYNSNQFSKLKENLSEMISMEFEELNERINEIEELIEKRVGDNTKKIKDLYSLQNKFNEVNKMNSQMIINQINQYDEEIEENEENRDQIFNSVESSMNKNLNNNNNNANANANANCFIKISQVNGNSKENFYMSPDKSYNSKSSSNSKSNKQSLNQDIKILSSNTSVLSNGSKSSQSTQSSQSSKPYESTQSSKSSELTQSSKSSQLIENVIGSQDKISKKYKIKNIESENEILLEINSNCIKTNTKLKNSQKSANIKKSLGEFSNIVKNNFANKFNLENVESLNDNSIETFLNGNSSELDENDNNNDYDSCKNNNIDFDIDHLLLNPEIFKKLNLINKNKQSKIIDITS